ncbi:maleylpyruvate isomerase N-terminal domain-containing protein, partial [Streptomyces sp. NPDC006863]|uniref:maleylpyruvate isomerase N-terminal domain-containing protein n=1 Tax=Streptomyces sp. NPDC006863 TaxID=3154779 RepID=UPI0033EEAF89
MDTHRTPVPATPATAASATRLPDLGPAARRITTLLGPVDDGSLDGPTPCPAYAVRELLGHLTGLATAFRDAARKDLGPSTATPPDAALPVLEDDWREALPSSISLTRSRMPSGSLARDARAETSISASDSRP